MRRTVMLVDPKASIPDPERDRLLPPEGVPVAWSPYWAGLLARGEITAEDVVEEIPAAAPTKPALAKRGSA